MRYHWEPAARGDGTALAGLGSVTPFAVRVETGTGTPGLVEHVVHNAVPCLSFCLIHPRPGPFTDFHPVRVCAVRERWRTPVNAGQHRWKACWGQPLRSSNLLSSATLTSKTLYRDRWHPGVPGRVVSFSGLNLSVARPLHRMRRNYLARSRASRPALNREQHAAEACTLPFRRVRRTSAVDREDRPPTRRHVRPVAVGFGSEWAGQNDRYGVGGLRAGSGDLPSWLRPGLMEAADWACPGAGEWIRAATASARLIAAG